MAWDPNSGLSFSDIAGISNPYNQPQPSPAPVQPNYDQANQIANDGVDTVKPPGPPDAAILDHSTKYDPKTGKSTIKVTMTESLYNEVQRLAGLGAQAETAFSQARKALEQKRDFLNAHPIVAGVGRIASAAASEYSGGPQGARISPLVHASGAYGNDLFGQSTDNLNAQIAGLSQQSMQAQQPYFNALERASAHEQADADRDALRADTKSRDLETARKNLANERIRISRDARASVANGSFDSESYIQERLAVDDSRASAEDAAKSLEAQQNEIRQTKEAKAKADRQADMDILDKRQAFQIKQLNATLASHEKVSENRAKYAEEAANLKDQKKENFVPAPILQQLKNLSFAENALDRVDKILNDPELAGNMTPYIGGAVSEFKGKMGNEKLQRAITNVKLETASAISATGAGARGFGPQERPYFQQLSTAFSNAPKSNAGIVLAWRDRLRQERMAILSNFKGTANNPDKFGHDAKLLIGDTPKEKTYNPKTGRVE